MQSYYSDQDDLDWDPRHDDGARYWIKTRRRRDADRDDQDTPAYD